VGLAINDDHRTLAEVARAFLTDQGGLQAARGTLDDGDGGDGGAKPAMWSAMAGLGWMGLHLPESHGGQGYGLSELAVVVEELGRVVAPGPFLATVMASAVIASHGSPALRDEVLSALADGSATASVLFDSQIEVDADGSLSGRAGIGWCADGVDWLLIPFGDDLVVVSANQSGVTTTRSDVLDFSRPAVSVQLSEVAVGPDRRVRGARLEAVRVARVLAAAEAVGGAQACIDASNEYAKVRVQFGRTIATFQAVKHHLANMLVAAELATAATWDAARATGDVEQMRLAAATAAARSLEAFQFAARMNIQLHGGIGFTWEHDAHLFFRRAASLQMLIDGGASAQRDVLELSRRGVHRELALDLPPEAESFRAEARAFLAEYQATPAEQRRKVLAESGYMVPHWAMPWGRGAGAVEQLVLEQEHADLEDPQLGIGGWVVLTLTQHGTPDQLERWVRSSLVGDLYWCQLFSEPEAGSDAAAIRTRGVRVDGGWLVTGQKVWTSGAQHSNRGMATVRTDPDAPKHAGVTMMVVDMKATGVEIRPLREITGEAMFNEVFFDDVFVPDDDVVGPVNQGWTVARATLGNERVSIGAGSRPSVSALDLVRMLDDYCGGDRRFDFAVTDLITEEHAMRLVNLRHAQRAVAGGGPGPEGNVTKLLSAEHAQRVTEMAVRLAGPAALSGREDFVVHEYLFDRCLSIAGGTSEITRNQIAERLLKLPRDPLLA
jgi:3-oxochol-4-en-24-oyl-CoA dehydrogenase